MKSDGGVDGSVIDENPSTSKASSNSSALLELRSLALAAAAASSSSDDTRSVDAVFERFTSLVSVAREKKEEKRGPEWKTR